MPTLKLENGTTMTVQDGHGIEVGDTITIANVPKPSLWRRLLIWLKLAEPLPLTKFKVVADSRFKSYAMYRQAPSQDKWHFWASFTPAWVAKNGMSGVDAKGVKWRMEGRHYG